MTRAIVLYQIYQTVTLMSPTELVISNVMEGNTIQKLVITTMEIVKYAIIWMVLTVIDWAMVFATAVFT